MPSKTGMVFHSLFRAHHNAAQARLTKRGVGDVGSPRLLHVLRDCQERGETPSQRELADLLRVTPATIATSLKSLERNGYVVREIDPGDSRRNLISITDKAVEAMEAAHQVFDTVDRDMLHGFTPEEVEQLDRYHLRMLENLYAIGGDKDAPPPPDPI